MGVKRRRKIYARDKYTCQICRQKPKGKGQLNAHHIKKWSEYPKLRFKISNGITVCLGCHKKIHFVDKEKINEK